MSFGEAKGFAETFTFYIFLKITDFLILTVVFYSQKSKVTNDLKYYFLVATITVFIFSG